ncbi:MAG: hypothetical protein KAG97_12985, partial [Victivallales bacterium]|nr:hypothetical protein [Victivallales bacterium]
HSFTGQRLLANAEIAPFITDLKQIDNANVRIYSVTDSASARFVGGFFKSADLASLETIRECVDKVVNDNGCVFLTDETTALNLLKKYNESEKTSGITEKTANALRGKKGLEALGKTKTNPKPVLALVLGRLTDERLAWAVGRSNVKLKKILDEFAAALRKESDNPVFERTETPLFEVGEPSSKLKHSVIAPIPHSSK